MKSVSYEKVGLSEQVEYVNPRRWLPMEEDFRINSFGIHERMPPVIVHRPAGTGDFLFMLFYDAVDLRLEDRSWQKVPSGSLMIWPRGASHNYGQTAYEWRHSWIHIDGGWVTERMQECRIATGCPLPLRHHSPMETCLWQMQVELTSHQQADGTILKNIFHNWLRELRRDSEQKNTVYIPDKIRQAKQYLDQHVPNRITLTELARKSAMSVPHLSAEFKRCYGESPINYLIGLRMRQARYLVLDRHLQIGEIGRRVGYDDIFHFSKLFKKHFGVSPRAMRKTGGE